MKYLLPLLFAASVGAAEFPNEIPEGNQFCDKFATVAEMVQEGHQEGVSLYRMAEAMQPWPQYMALVFTIYQDTPVFEDFYDQTYTVWHTEQLAIETCYGEFGL